MHVMIATDGHVNPAQAAKAVANLSADGTITVLTVVEVPRTLFADMRAAGYTEGIGDAPKAPGNREVPIVPAIPNTHWMGDDVAIAQYVRSKTTVATGPLTAELDALGATYKLVALESEDAATTILEQVDKLDVDILVIGTRGLGRFEGMLGSISTKLARRASCSVLLIR